MAVKSKDGIGHPVKRTSVYFGMPEYYKAFKRSHPTIKITPALFNSIVTDYNLAIRDKIIKDGFEYHMYATGTLAVYKYKRKIRKNPETGRYNLPIDKKATWELWNSNPKAREEKKYVYHMNEHTDGYGAKIFWLKPYKVNAFRNQLFYVFSPVVRFSSAVHKAIMNEKSMDKYFIHEPFNFNKND